MNIKNRITKLETSRNAFRSLNVKEMTDAELEAHIAILIGLPKGTSIPDAMLQRIVDETNWKQP